ncbi:hypothetical protein [Methylomagnum ishizawai]|uniref:hypothetical protein n=1 Tax=Methylomagnum ishizawai TaxID=1760988 RepID=UPI001FED175F|nr:hypothetical protein [Methylomagnum ishizawai]
MALHRPIAPALLLPLLLSPPVQAGDGDGTDYRLGRGYALGDSGFRLGGYASAVVAAPRNLPWRFALKDLSLFVTWEREHWRFFSETEVSNALSAGQGQSLGVHEAEVEIERLYLDYLHDDALALRFGKFLTPIGRWNLLHAEPVVWTTTRPVATYLLFATNDTGLMLHGNVPLLGKRLEYQVYGGLGSALDPKQPDNPFANSIGAHLNLALTDTLELGLSYANFRLDENHAPSGTQPSDSLGYSNITVLYPVEFPDHDADQRQNLVGLDAAWSYRRFEVMSEWVFRAGGQERFWQGYVQGVAPLAGTPWYAVGRYEYFQQEWGPPGQLGVFGLALRPIPPLVWKVEYRLGSHNEAIAPDGLYGSIAVLF